MITQEKNQKMYESLVNDVELTTKELKNCGFNKRDINSLIEQGILSRIKRGHYAFLDVESLFNYGKKLVKEKEHEKATLCFEKCYEINSLHGGTNFQLFFRSINKKDYNEAFKYFDTLLNTENPYYKNDANLYLYLLAIITEIPEKYQEYARYLDLNNIKVLVQDKRYKDIQIQNVIRFNIIQKKFAYAAQLLGSAMQKTEPTLQDIILKSLLYQAAKVETKNKRVLLKLLKEKRYDEAIIFLEDKQRRYVLSLNDEDILRLLYMFMRIKGTKQLPVSNIDNTLDIHEAIIGYNYELALKLSEKYCQKNQMNKSNNPLNILLTELCMLIKTMSQKETEQEIEFLEPNAENLDKTNNDIDDLIKTKYELLKNGRGVILLYPMSEEKARQVYECVKKYPDMVVFTVGEDYNRQMVLRYKSVTNEDLAVKDLLNAGDLAYRNGDYDSCIENYLKLLRFGKPKSYVYAKLGLAYLKKGDNDLAVEYLTIATLLDKGVENGYNFNELIDFIHVSFSKKDKKCHATIELEEFNQDDPCYGIKNFEFIDTYIRENRLDVVTACNNLGINNEDMNIINLIYARICYTKGAFAKGDEFLQFVERSKNKSKKVIKILEDITRRKRFFVYSEIDELKLTRKVEE